MCLHCLAERTGLDLDRVRDAITVLDADLRLIHHVGRCPSCLKRDRALLRLDESAGARRPSLETDEGRQRHNGARCAKCGKPTGAIGHGVVLRDGRPYHTTCFEGATRQVGTPETAAALVCKCEHSRAMHQYERSRRAWTVCRSCRCVRFKVPSPPPAEA